MKIYLAFFGISAIYLWQCLGTLKQEAAICNYNGILGKFNKLQSINQIANLNIIIFYQSEFYTIKILYCIFSEHIKVPFVYLLLLFFLRDCTGTPVRSRLNFCYDLNKKTNMLLSKVSVAKW